MKKTAWAIIISLLIILLFSGCNDSSEKTGPMSSVEEEQIIAETFKDNTSLIEENNISETSEENTDYAFGNYSLEFVKKIINDVANEQMEFKLEETNLEKLNIYKAKRNRTSNMIETVEIISKEDSIKKYADAESIFGILEEYLLKKDIERYDEEVDYTNKNIDPDTFNYPEQYNDYLANNNFYNYQMHTKDILLDKGIVSEALSFAAIENNNGDYLGGDMVYDLMIPCTSDHIIILGSTNPHTKLVIYNAIKAEDMAKTY